MKPSTGQRVDSEQSPSTVSTRNGMRSNYPNCYFTRVMHLMLDSPRSEVSTPVKLPEPPMEPVKVSSNRSRSIGQVEYQLDIRTESKEPQEDSSIEEFDQTGDPYDLTRADDLSKIETNNEIVFDSRDNTNQNSTIISVQKSIEVKIKKKLKRRFRLCVRPKKPKPKTNQFNLNDLKFEKTDSPHKLIDDIDITHLDTKLPGQVENNDTWSRVYHGLLNQ